MKRCRLLSLLSLILLVTKIACAESKIKPVLEESMIGEIIQILKEKGIITQEEMDRPKARLEEKEKRGRFLSAYYKDGFFLETPEKNFKLKVGGRVQADFYSPDSNAQNDTFTMRRVRIHTKGTLFKNTEFKAEIDFGEGKDANLTDGYINFTHLPFANIQLGQYKEPFGLEKLTSSRFVDFVERSIISDQIAPGRDIGIMLHSNLFEGLMGYGLGIFNGSGKNRRRDENDDKDVAGRVYVRPFMKSKNPLLEGLQIGGAFTWGKQEGEIKDISIPTSDTRFVTWTKGVRSDGTRWRSGVELAWVLGSLSLKGEWMWMKWVDLRLLDQKKDVDVDGWYISASWFLTGEKENLKKGTFGRITPVENFNPSKGKWGAWELTARYESFDIDEDIFARGYAMGTDSVNSFTLGINWYLHDMLRISLNYVRNEYDDNLADLEGDDEEDLILTRFQVDF